MQRRIWAVVIAAGLAGACGVARTSEEDQKQALERRVAELEQKLAAAEQASPAPDAKASPADETVAEAAAPPAEAPPTPAKARAVEPAHPARPARTASTPKVASRRPEPPSGPVIETPERDEPRAFEPAPAAPMPPPAPQLRIPKDTTLRLVLEDSLSSERNHAGDKVVARVESAVSDSGDVVLPGGSYVEGRVVSAQPSGRVKGKARVEVAFDHIVVRGSRYRLQTTGLTLEAEDSHKRDGAVVAGGTVVGALLGKIAGGSAGKGAVIGGMAGGGAVLATKGKEIDLPAGSKVSTRVTRSREIEN